MTEICPSHYVSLMAYLIGFVVFGAMVVIEQNQGD